jgi:predicted metal-dependent enzyme (double-stranded beta helix superfamily)
MDHSLETQDWLVTKSGICTPCTVQPDTAQPDLGTFVEPYRLYRFLTDLEDILRSTSDDQQRLQLIQPLVRRLLTSSYWLQFEFTPPSLNPGWSVKFLYQEHNFPITIQMVAWLPGNISPIHNHGTWGLVAVVSGQEKNRFWRPASTPDTPNKIELVGEKLLVPGDIIGFLPDVIRSVEPVGDEPAVTFNLYGKTNYSQRFEFDPIQHLVKPF